MSIKFKDRNPYMKTAFETWTADGRLGFYALVYNRQIFFWFIFFMYPQRQLFSKIITSKTAGLFH